MQFLTSSLLELITQTSTNLPPDVRAAMAKAVPMETPGTQAGQALEIIAGNVDTAYEERPPSARTRGCRRFTFTRPRG